MKVPIPRWSDMKRSRKARVTMLIIFSAWLIIVVLSPFSLPSGSVTDLSGKVGEIDNGEALEGMNPVARIIYAIGDINCHQLTERSLFINGNQMSFCSRDLGIFIGLVAGVSLALLLDIRISILVFLLTLIPMGVDGLLQILTDYQSTNSLRLVTGIVAGAGVSLLLSRFAMQVLDSYDRGSEVTAS